MDLTGDKLNAAIQLCRHLPTVEIANAIEGIFIYIYIYIYRGRAIVRRRRARTKALVNLRSTIRNNDRSYFGEGIHTK